MKSSQIKYALLLMLLILVGCKHTKEKENQRDKNGWEKETQVLKTIKNVNFTFPYKGFAFNKKENYVLASFKAMEENAKIIDLKTFKDTVNIRFLSSRKESEIYTGQASSGSAWPHIKTLYVVANEKIKSPIKHELMHLMVMLEWGNEHLTSSWLNEGLATYAENNCNSYNVAQIYRYFMQTDKLVTMDLLASDFYKQPEMVGYHQSAYIVEYLLKNYSVKQLKRLWREGFDKFDEIYGVPFSQIKFHLEKEILEKYPTAPEINWEVFNEGCN